MQRLLLAGVLMLAPAAATAQQVFLQDFELDFPGPGQPGFVGFTFQGDSVGSPGNVVLTQEVSTDGVGGSQAYKLTLGTANSTGFHYGGVGAFPAGFNALILEGAVGTTNPANYTYSFDLRVAGAVPGNPVPLRGEFVFFEPDYELETGIDINNDGLFDQGADSYILPLNFTANETGFTTNSFRLDQGAGPATNAVAGQNPYFSNQGTFVLRWFWGAGEFGFDADNVITIDNVRVDFTAPPIVSGDYTADGLVDAADYTLWRDNLGRSITLVNEGAGVTPGSVTAEDRAHWAGQYAAPAASLATAAPEPAALASLVLALGGLAARRPLR